MSNVNLAFAQSPLVVTSTADTNAAGTLRSAINHANANVNNDDINFNIAGAGRHVIAPTSQLSIIIDDGISIDGTTQNLATCGSTVNGTGGLSDRQLRIVLFGTNHSGDVLRISGANDVVIRGLTIGNGASDGLSVTDSDRLNLVCNHFGVSTASTGNIGNTGYGLLVSDSNGIGLGDGALAGANVFGFNTDSGARVDNSADLTVIKNFFGVGIDGALSVGNGNEGLEIRGSTDAIIGNNSAGGNVISNNVDDGIALWSGSTATISGNFVGTNAIGTVGMGNGGDGLNIDDTGLTRVEDGTIAGQNVIAANANDGLRLNGDAIVIIDNNLIGTGKGGEALGNNVGVFITGTSSTRITNNVISNNTNDGVEINSVGAIATILSNSIYANGGQGIDLGSDGVTSNDVGDGDSGANDLLNFPAINTLTAYGTTAIDFDINIDVPSAANGYRIDFYRNSAFETNGEGEIHLGSVDLASAGGDLNFTGSFTANVALSDGDFISATTTRKTGDSTYDITS